MKFGIPHDYFEPGLFTPQQHSVFLNILNGKSVSENLSSDRAAAFQQEFNSPTAQQCDSWFMDRVLTIIEGQCKEVGMITCMFAETFDPSKPLRFRQQVQEAVYAHVEKMKLIERRFVASFFNISSHWYWYVIDNYEKVCYTGDSFNQLAVLKNAQEQIHPQPLLHSVLLSYADAWCSLTGQNGVNFITRAVTCPAQSIGDSTSCGQLACASLMAFLMRIFHDNQPIHRFAEPITLFDGKAAQFIKQRLVMSLAHSNFKQKLNAISFQAPNVELEETYEKIVHQPQGNHNTVCLKVAVPDATELDFNSSLNQYIQSGLLEPIQKPPSHITQRAYDAKTALLNLQPNYFFKKSTTIRTKVFVGCQFNPQWIFNSYEELLVATVAVYSNVNKKGSDKSLPKPPQALTQDVVALAAMVWKEQHNHLLDRQVWETELQSTQYNKDRTKVPKASRVLIKSNGIWKTTQYGFDRYIKSKDSKDPGPCIFIEVQNCKGRKSKSNSKKLQTKMEHMRLTASPYKTTNRNKTWISIVKDVLSMTHCPQSAKSIYNYLMQTHPDWEPKQTKIRQALTSGSQGVAKRAAEFFNIEVVTKKISQSYGGLRDNYQYHQMIESNAYLIESAADGGVDRGIIWKKFIPECDISGCLTVPAKSQLVVFTVDETRLQTKFQLFCGTLIEIEKTQTGEMDPSSRLLFLCRSQDMSEVNLEIYTHFDVQVYRATRDIAAWEYLTVFEYNFLPF